MARRRTRTESAPVETQEFTQGTIDKGIERLSRRIAEVAQIDPNRIRYNDPSVKNVESQIRNSILNPSLTVSSSRSGAQAAFGEGFARKHAMDVVIEIK